MIHSAVITAGPDTRSAANSPRYALLGPVEAVADGHAILIPRPRQRAVLSYLLLRANKVVSVDQLEEALWGGAAPSTARTQIQGDISALRRAHRTVEVEPPVHTKGPGYLIQVNEDQLDIDLFRRHITESRKEFQNGNWEAGFWQIQSGLSLWRGLPLADVTASFAASAQSELLELKLNADELIVDFHIAQGDHKSAIAALTPLVAAYPLHEELRRKLMLTLFRDGRQSEALRHARDLRTQLVEQQGLTPGRSFIDLEEAILRGDSSLDVPRPSQSVRILPKPAAVPAQLPRGPSDLTGRDEYLETLDRLAFEEADPSQRTTVIALVGSAGVGKTALAVHWAHRVANRFPDGQLYVNLRGYAGQSSMSSADALSRILPSLGVAAEAVPSDLEDSANLFRSIVANKRMLIVLDNVLSANQVRPLLSANQDTLTLITSRSKLTGLAVREGARRVTVKPLAPTESVALLTRVLGAERLRDESAQAAELARACNGLPLALRIAAANIANRPVARIGDFVRELTASDVLSALHVTGDEETSVRTVFDQSYATVSELERRYFCLLGLIPGPDISVKAICALAGTELPEVRQVLDQLLEAHLVDEPVSGRYAMHDLLRAYARSRVGQEVPEQGRAAAKDRLVSWYLHSADNATRFLFPQWIRLELPEYTGVQKPIEFGDVQEAVAWLDREYANLLAAQREAADTPYSWLLADSLRGYFFVRRPVNDWLSAAHAALSAATAHRDPHAQVATRLGLGQAYQRLGEYPRALQQFESALRLARRIGKADAEIACQGKVGSILVETGELVRAIPHLREALAAGTDSAPDPGRLVTFSAIGMAYQHLGQLPEAVEIHRRALALAKQIESTSSEAYASANLGTALQALGELPDARRHIEHSIALLRQIGDHDVESACLSELAAAHLALGQPARAMEYAERAWRLSNTVESPQWAIPVLSMLATVRHDLEQHERAVLLAHKKRTPEFMARTLLAASRTALELDSSDVATAKAREALQLASRLGYRVIEGNASIVLGELELSAGRLSAAAGYAERALTTFDGTKHRPGEDRARWLLDQARRR
jgi:DNA-binding SARP family transcriptional activator/tetratricopeptide (TPR) repeat protein